MQISKYKFNAILAIAFVLTLLTPILGFRQTASAVTDTCTWIGGTDLNFNTAANWSCSIDGATIPENGDTLEFNMTSLSATETLNNDIVGLSVAGINRTGSNGDLSSDFDYIINGNDLTLTGAVSGGTVDDYGDLHINTGIVLGDNVTLTSTNGIFFQGSFDLSTYDLTIGGSSDFANVYVNGIQGSGDVIVEQNGMLSISGDGTTFTGNFLANAGILSVYDESTLGSNTSITVSGSGSLVLAGSGNFVAPVTLGGTGNSCLGPKDCSLTVSGEYGVENSEITFTGGVTLTSNIVVNTVIDLIINEPYTDNGNTIELSASTGTVTLPNATVVKQAKEEVTINESDKTTAAITVWPGQTVIMNGERSSVYVDEGGVLKGTGNITGSVYVTDGGAIAPGLSPGCLTTGDLVINGSYEFEIDGNTVCTEYDQIDVTGTVTVTGATLDLTRGTAFVPALNDEFVLINNDASDAVTGEFTGWAQGAQVVVDQVTYEIDYAGGDGNDVVVTVVAIDSALVEEADAPDTGLQNVLANPFVGLIALVLSGATLGVLRQKKLI